MSLPGRSAIGLAGPPIVLEVGRPADLILFGKECGQWRRQRTIARLVFDAGHDRLTMKEWAFNLQKLAGRNDAQLIHKRERVT